MKLLSLSLALLLIHLNVFYIPINSLYFFLHLNFIPHYLFHIIISITIIYFFIYKIERLKYLKLNTFTQATLTIGSSLLLIFTLMKIFMSGTMSEMIPIVYLIFLPILAKSLIFIGLISLFLENYKIEERSTNFYQKIILFLGITLLFSQFELLEHFVSFITSYTVHNMNIEATLQSSFISIIIIKIFLSLLIVGVFSIITNFLSRIVQNKYDIFFLLGGIIFHLIWIVLTFNSYIISDPRSPYFNENPYISLEVITNSLFLIFFIRILLLAKPNSLKGIN